MKKQQRTTMPDPPLPTDDLEDRISRDPSRPIDGWPRKENGEVDEGDDDREGGDPFEDAREALSAVERTWREPPAAATGNPPKDDPLGVKHGSGKCPNCGAVINFPGTYWECAACGASAEHPHPDEAIPPSGNPATDRVVGELAGEAQKDPFKVAHLIDQVPLPTIETCDELIDAIAERIEMLKGETARIRIIRRHLIALEKQGVLRSFD